MTVKLVTSSGSFVGYAEVEMVEYMDSMYLPEVISPKQSSGRVFLLDKESQSKVVPLYSECSFSWAENFRVTR